MRMHGTGLSKRGRRRPVGGRKSATALLGIGLLGLLMTAAPAVGGRDTAAWAGEEEPPVAEPRTDEPVEDCGCKRRFRRLDNPIRPKETKAADDDNASSSRTGEQGEGARPSD
ncbi:hypothetical protein KAJ83_01750 [Marivibrio halodurans]|uniref:Uncharacterized protein n=1 Tax=Marivibrio halodurans TaxID=2039722 RepID=A0A8J7V138_9PROT|nr:hypothetical protein [Marivibrio halodurans]MBP5855716.1 hypothetical protein [Marivibrio halodurans]